VKRKKPDQAQSLRQSVRKSAVTWPVRSAQSCLSNFSPFAPLMPPLQTTKTLTSWTPGSCRLRSLKAFVSKILWGVSELRSPKKNETHIGTYAINALKEVSCALVHHYDAPPSYCKRTLTSAADHALEDSSEFLTSSLAACLRLIRPMPQFASRMSGAVADDGSFIVKGFEHPVPLFSVPEAHLHFKMRNRDAEDLKRYGSEFLRAMRGEHWKVRRAADMHEYGHFLADEDARYWLWCSALGSIFTTNKQGHREEKVAKARIKWFLGEQTSIYSPGDIPDSLPQPSISIANVIDDIYVVRNCLAYGDPIPTHYFETMRQGIDHDVSHIEVLAEGLSFIVRSSLLTILRDGLLDHFANAAAAESYFDGHHLTLDGL